jgi:putative acyl-CoA dehydrogenase
MGERAHDVFLPDQAVEILRAVFTGKNLIRHGRRFDGKTPILPDAGKDYPSPDKAAGQQQNPPTARRQSMHWPTHEVSNQPPPLAGINLFDSDPALVAAVRRETANATGMGGAGSAGNANDHWPAHRSRLTRLGGLVYSAEAQALAEQANRHPPELLTHDRYGHRIDALRFDPAWHALLAQLRASGLQARAWLQPEHGAQVARAAAFYLHAQLECGSLCPVTMTFAALPILRKESFFPALADKLQSETHDARDLPIGAKSSLLIGMGLTEKQGGSDLRGTQTEARPACKPGRGERYLLTGHKWFFSAPSCDAHLVLAKSDGGLSAFFVPRWREDGSKNPVLIQQLKDKLGNRSNASAEVEFLDAEGLLVGEPGRGIATLIEMANTTRLDCAIASAALMRAALLQAIHHARHRVAFGRPLASQPLMMNVLADLALESQAAMLLVLRIARAIDAGDLAFVRLMTPAAKFWICKRAMSFTAECMEVLGGNGYVESAPLARLYREAPVNAIWEGSGNVMCLDVLRAARQDENTVDALLSALAATLAGHPAWQSMLTGLRSDLARPPHEQELMARRIAQRLVLGLQASLMAAHAGELAATAFLASRREADHGQVAGLLACGPDNCAHIIADAWPDEH